MTIASAASTSPIRASDKSNEPSSGAASVLGDDSVIA